MQPIVVFAGPSISAAAICQYCAEAQVRPPVQLGDVCRLAAAEPMTLVLLDGYFSQVPAVWHKEIMQALSQGCRVIGAASMGALRAAELVAEGMEGVGWIYQQFLTGELTDDDEVALLHADATLAYQSLSLPLVNLRYLLTTQWLTATQHSALTWLIQELKAEFYPRRTLQRCESLLRSQQMEQQTVTDLLQLLQQPKSQIKYLDALAAIVLAQQPCTTAARPAPECTVFLQQLQQQCVVPSQVDPCQLLAKLLSFCLQLGVALPTVETARVQQQFTLWAAHKAFRDNQAVVQWLQQHELRAHDLQQLMQLLAQLSMVEASPLSSAFHVLLQESAP